VIKLAVKEKEKNLINNMKILFRKLSSKIEYYWKTENTNLCERS